MTKPIHIMLDLETWGKRPGCDIRSIGACVFNPATGFIHDGSLGTIRPFYIATDNPIIGRGANWLETLGFTPNPIDPCYNCDDLTYRKYPLKRDPSTVDWWSTQSDEAQAAFADPVDLKQALLDFYCWLTVAVSTTVMGEQVDCRLWSHGPAFDIAILGAAYHATNALEPLGIIEPWWHYRAPRDTRTLFDAAGIADEGGSYRTFMSAYNTGTPHHALHDAIAQARCVCAAQERIADRERQIFYNGWNSRDIAAPSINAVGLSVHDAYQTFIAEKSK